MLKFVTFAVKTQLDIRIMEFLDEEGNRRSAPAVSGRMLKHWHYEGMKHLINNKDLCDACRIGEPMRPGILDKEKLS